MSSLHQVVFATAVATGIAFTTAQSSAQAQQKFPTTPIRIVVPNPVGSQGDTLARMIGQKMNESWGQSVVVDNRTGGIGTLAAAVVAKATSDGQTLLMISSAFAIGAVLQPT